jgi:hypothetical protein
MDDAVRVTTALGEPEAEAFCQRLRQNGIECAQRPTPEDDSAFENFGGEGGTREILVRPADLERARELLSEQ